MFGVQGLQLEVYGGEVYQDVHSLESEHGRSQDATGV